MNLLVAAGDNSRLDEPLPSLSKEDYQSLSCFCVICSNSARFRRVGSLIMPFTMLPMKLKAQASTLTASSNHSPNS